MTARISATLLPPPAGRLTVGLLYDIIYNSVDIFKISFIILIAGFTYISGLIDRILLFFSGMFYGLSTSLCIDLLRGGQVYEGEGGFLVTVLFIFRMLVLCSVIISGGIVSELYSTYWRFHRNTYSLLKSWYFWKYNLVFLILFGYVILAEFGYRIYSILFCKDQTEFESKKRKFKLFDMNRDGRGVEKGEDSRGIFAIF